MIYANRPYGVRVTHRPTGRKVFVSAWSAPRGEGPLSWAKRWALRMLACVLRHPEPAKPPLVRTYDLGGPCGPFIRDGVTGRRLADDEAVNGALDRGEIDSLLLERARAARKVNP